MKSNKPLNCNCMNDVVNMLIESDIYFVIDSYEKSGTATTEVRRMFLAKKDITGYKAYTTKLNDP
jgi:hypothetical protein